MPSPNYQMRPSKHVERKMFVEAFQHLRNAEYKISKYHYLGFGSFYYTDFILFNRLLSIKKMTCLEKDLTISKRMRFNKPFKFIQLKMEEVSNYLPSIKEDEKYIVWLDFESNLNEDILSNVGSLVSTLMEGSILLITVNAHVGLLPDGCQDKQEERIESLRSKYKDDLDPFCGEVVKEDITSNGLPLLFIRSLRSKISDSMKGRPDDTFHQIFNYIYKDGLRMLTLGGIIDRKESAQKIKNALKDLSYINYSDNPIKISIPALTVREKLLLDQKITKTKKIGTLPFELAKQEITDYVNYSTHYPTFHEVFMN